MDKLIPAFETSLFDSNLTDLANDAVEFGIDSLLDDGIFKDIPIVSTIVGVAKTAQYIFIVELSYHFFVSTGRSFSRLEFSFCILLY